MVQKQAMVAAKKQQLDLEKSKLEKYRKQIEAATIIAPSPGIVVYSQNFWDQNGPVVLKEGVEVRQGQGLIILPDLSSMIAQCKVHEAQMDRVEKGQRVTVRVEALKDQVFTGTVKRVGVLPDNEDGWMNPENKVYATTIALDGDTTMLRPGQSATAEIHVAHKDDVLSVPVQAVLRKGRVNYAWRLGEGSPEAVPVKTGITNDKFVEILDGLALGDRIALSWPTGAREPEFPDLERQLEQEEKDLAAKAAKAGEAETVPESQKPAGAPESPESKDGAGGKDGAAPGTAAPTSATSGSGAGFTSKATTDPKASGVEVPNGAR
jgi:HlyD family secretion protein